VEKAKSHQSVDWRNYFKSIRTECPWSYRADQQGLIDITPWQGEVIPLGTFQARVYLIEASDQEVEALASALDHGEDEWLFSYPGYGDYATPVSVLIQQNRKQLNDLRSRL
jgi:hypothetical protein